jgi:hypothetical protein
MRKRELRAIYYLSEAKALNVKMDAVIKNAMRELGVIAIKERGVEEEDGDEDYRQAEFENTWK